MHNTHETFRSTQRGKTHRTAKQTGAVGLSREKTRRTLSRRLTFPDIIPDNSAPTRSGLTFVRSAT